MNIKDTRLSSEAVSDLNDGKEFYNHQQLGVGDYFWDSIISDIESLSIYAGIHKKTHGYFRMFAKRFPYVIYYEVIDEIVCVVSVLPMRRDPEWLRSKIKKIS